MHIVISEFMDEAAVATLRADFDVRYEPDLVDRRDALLAALPEADALIVRNRTRVDAALLAAGPRLRAVGRLGVGLDNIDVPARSEEHTSALQTLMRNSYDAFCLKKQTHLFLLTST